MCIVKRQDKINNLNSSFFSAAIVHSEGRGVLSMMTNMGRLRLKGVLFSGFRQLKG